MGTLNYSTERQKQFVHWIAVNMIEFEWISGFHLEEEMTWNNFPEDLAQGSNPFVFFSMFVVHTNGQRICFI